MLVKGYIILRAEGAPPIPRHLRGLTGPYLFLSEAEQSRHVISSATGISCQISSIEVRRILSELVRLGDSFIIADVWNITATESGFRAEVMMQGKLYEVRRESPEDMWHYADQEHVTSIQMRGEARSDTKHG